MYGDVDATHLAKEQYGEWNINTINLNRCHQGIFYRKEVFLKYGGYNTRYRVCADHVLNWRWFLSDDFSHRYIPVVVAHFSDGGMSATDTSTRDYLFCREYSWIKLRYGFKKLSHTQRYECIKEGLSYPEKS